MMKCPKCEKEDFKSINQFENHMVLKCGIPFDVALHLANKHLEEEGIQIRPQFGWDKKFKKW